jgi:hypothetical protein
MVAVSFSSDGAWSLGVTWDALVTSWCVGMPGEHTYRWPHDRQEHHSPHRQVELAVVQLAVMPVIPMYARILYNLHARWWAVRAQLRGESPQLPASEDTPPPREDAPGAWARGGAVAGGGAVFGGWLGGGHGGRARRHLGAPLAKPPSHPPSHPLAHHRPRRRATNHAP